MPALLLGANAPDIDAAWYFVDSVRALQFRRGITHGVVAMVVLPLVLAVLLIGIDRLASRMRKRPAGPVDARALFIVSLIGVLSHPLLDLMNTYGVRLLAPFSWRWFYGDTWFIVDPWVLLALGTGILVSRSKGPGAARMAIVTVVSYAVVMAWMSGVARWWVREASPSLLAANPQRVLASPRFANPFSREIIVETDTAYFGGTVNFIPPRVRLVRDPMPRNSDLLPLAREHPEGRAFLSWSRFPSAERIGNMIHLSDVRYGGPNTSWARVDIPVSGPVRLTTRNQALVLR
jgi:inner membrane protein